MKTLKLVLLVIVLTVTACAQEKKTSLKQQPENKISLNKQYLIAVLDTVFREEQEPIRSRDAMMDKYGVDSEQANKYQKIYERNHPINEKKIRAILDNYGWPDIDVIGEQGNITICAVIQHSDNDIRINYLPLMRKAVNDKQLHPRFLVRAEDRIATERGDLQIYGGQMKYYPETKTFNVWPVYDPVNIDKRRAKIGLDPIAEFLKNRFNFDWNLEEQIKRTEEFEKQRQN
ncbi:MAG: hypothetical protein QM499_12250 [Flavobacteriaceae bacterium]